ncbi:hypothetical protein K488DRAFT_84133 [Vararia minispora EC-137]|uniref:Uncharacterized protein n=1 Tax=Vararia minispora EC-137 TaxID=1314806 RepID=A0ACB8QRG5_9AGAM|nr:hypothetical protein K488DRAFT_84133 [Vararia minispora EC-137]
MRAEIDLLQPDRFMDLRFSACDYNILPPEEIPTDLALFDKSQEKGRRYPPMTLKWQGQDYILLHHEHIEETTEALLRPLLRITRLSIVDMEIPVQDERSPACQIRLESDTDDAWAQFYAHCDRLTGKGYTPLPKTGLMSFGELLQDQK